MVRFVTKLRNLRNRPRRAGLSLSLGTLGIAPGGVKFVIQAKELRNLPKRSGLSQRSSSLGTALGGQVCHRGQVAFGISSVGQLSFATEAGASEPPRRSGLSLRSSSFWNQ